LKQRVGLSIPVLEPDAGQIQQERGQMDDTSLVNFPVPMLTALLCCVVALRVVRLELGARRASYTFSALFGLCAVLVGLRFGYGVDALIGVQRVLPLFLGPMMFLGFYSLTISRRNYVRTVVLHLGAPIVGMGVFLVLVDNLRHLDWIISASYVAYLGALFMLWRRGSDNLIYARVNVAHGLSNWMLRAMGVLVFVFTLDTAIALDFALNGGAHVTALISYGTIPIVVVLFAALMTLPKVVPEQTIRVSSTPQIDNQDAETLRQLSELMVREELFLDAALTLQRLAKRLHLPARQVSAAINRTKRMNVSQYVNEFRLAYAVQLLKGGTDSVSSIAEASGFLTRSNFYREFQRVYGQSPTEYRRSDTIPE
jgi:AraC-like DNA-binding protein